MKLDAEMLAAAALQSAVPPPKKSRTGAGFERSGNGPPLDLDRAAIERAASVGWRMCFAMSPACEFPAFDSRSAHPTRGLTLRGWGNAASRVTLTLDGVPQDDPSRVDRIQRARSAAIDPIR